jgi:hypothetical protein
LKNWKKFGRERINLPSSSCEISMKKNPPLFVRLGDSRSMAGSALIIVLSFVVLLTVVVLAMLSHSLLNRMISNASSNVTKTDLYAHGAVDQIIGDLRQEIVAGSTVASVTPATGGPPSIASPDVVNSANVSTGTIYRPSSVAASVPYPSGPSSYANAVAAGATGNPMPFATTVWNTMPNLVKESAHGVAFEPYDTTVPQRAAAVSTDSKSDPSGSLISGSADGASLNGRFVSVTRWNKALLLPKASATFNTVTSGTAMTIKSDSGTTTTPVATFVAPDWVLTPADGSVGPTTTGAMDFSFSTTTSNINPKSPKYIVGRYAYTIYNEGGLLDANVAGCPANSTVTSGLTSAQAAILSRKGPSAFADLTQLPGIADLTTLEGSNRGQHIVDSLLGWRNPATLNDTVTSQLFPTYKVTQPDTLNYFTYLLGLSSNFMSTGYAPPYTSPGYTDQFSGQVLTDQAFSSRQQMISFFENTIAQKEGSIPLATEQAYLQDAMMYLGTFSRTLNQPSYWPDPTRPMVVGPQSDGGDKSVGNGEGYTTESLTGSEPSTTAYTGGNSAWQLDNTYNPPFKSITVGSNGGSSGWNRNDGTTAVLGEPLVKKRFPLSRLMWLTYKGPSALLSTSDPLFTKYQLLYTGSSSGSAPAWLTQLWNEGTAANIKNYFGLTWTAGPGSGGIGGYWTYNHGITSSGVTILGSLSNVAAASRDADFFELLKAAVNCGSVGSALTTIGGAVISGSNVSGGNLNYPAVQGGAVTPQIFQLGANIIDEANPTQYPTHIIYTFAASDQRSVYGAMDLPYFQSLNPCAYIVTAPTVVTSPAVTPDGSPGTLTTPGGLGTGVILEVPSIWNPYDVNGPAPGAGLAPTNLRIAAAAPLITLDSNLGGSGWTPSTAPPATLSYLLADTYGTTSLTVAYNPVTPNDTYVTAPWTSESSAALTFSNPASGSTLYREPTALIKKGVPDANLTYDPNSLLASNYATNVTEASSTNPYIGFFVANFPLRWQDASNNVYTTNTILFQQNPITVRMEYSTSGASGPWVPYMEYMTAVEEDTMMPVQELGTAAYPNLLTPNVAPSNPGGNSTGSLWNWNNAGSPGTVGTGEMICTWDPRTWRWGTPYDVVRLPFIDGTPTTVPTTFRTVTLQPGAIKYSTSHSAGTNLAYSGVYEPNFGVIFGTKQQNLWSTPGNSPSTDYYMDGDGTVRRASGAYLGGTPSGAGNINAANGWSYTANSTVGLMLAGTVAASGVSLSGASAPTPVTNQSQSRPIILHRPYRSVAELGHVFSDTPFRNIDFFTPESGYSALLDVFCINEDYRPDALAAGRVDLNTKQAPVLQALLAGTYRDEENNLSPVPAGAAPNLTSSEAVAISQALVKRTTVGGTNPSVSLTTPQPLSNISDIVGRWITGTTPGSVTTGSPGSGANPINGAASYDGFSADLSSQNSAGNYGLYADTGVVGNPAPGSAAYPTGNYNIIQRFREATMRAFSDSGQAGTWNLLIDVVAQSGRYPSSASSLSNFLVEGERRYWVHVSIDRSTGQIIDENIEPVNE